MSAVPEWEDAADRDHAALALITATLEAEHVITFEKRMQRPEEQP